jgi:hypothetical protein
MAAWTSHRTVLNTGQSLRHSCDTHIQLQPTLDVSSRIRTLFSTKAGLELVGRERQHGVIASNVLEELGGTWVMPKIEVA